MAALKTLVIRPADLGMSALGTDSDVADVSVSVRYTAPAAINGVIIPIQPMTFTNVDDEGVSVQLVANDDPAITAGKGFGIRIDIVTRPRTGWHAQAHMLRRVITITTADPETVNLADKPLDAQPGAWVDGQVVAAQVAALQAQLDALNAQFGITERGVTALPQGAGVLGLYGPGVTNSGDTITLDDPANVSDANGVITINE